MININCKEIKQYTHKKTHKVPKDHHSEIIILISVYFQKSVYIYTHVQFYINEVPLGMLLLTVEEKRHVKDLFPL